MIEIRRKSQHDHSDPFAAQHDAKTDQVFEDPFSPEFRERQVRLLARVTDLEQRTQHGPSEKLLQELALARAEVDRMHETLSRHEVRGGSVKERIDAFLKEEEQKERAKMIDAGWDAISQEQQARNIKKEQEAQIAEQARKQDEKDVRAARVKEYQQAILASAGSDADVRKANAEAALATAEQRAKEHKQERRKAEETRIRKEDEERKTFQAQVAQFDQQQVDRKWNDIGTQNDGFFRKLKRLFGDK